MATQGSTGSEPSMTALVSGIVHDAEELFKQQVALLKHDLRADIRQTKEAATSLVVGGIVTNMGAILLMFMIVHLLNWLIPALPLWSCFAIVGVVLTGVGLAWLKMGAKTLETLNPLPEQSIAAMKENVQWTTKPSTSAIR